MTNGAGTGFEIELGPDSLTVALVLTGTRPVEEITKAHIVAVLEGRGIIVKPSDDDRIARLVQRLHGGHPPHDDMIIVKGRPPVHGRPGRFIDLVSGPKLRVGQRSKARPGVEEQLRVVHAGQPLLKIVLPNGGKPGVDVFGREVQCRPGRPIKLQPGLNVEMAEDGRTLRATAGGRFEVSDNVAAIHPQLTIRNDEDLPEGLIRFDGDVYIDKDVDEHVHLKARQTIVITGSVEGATVQTPRSIMIGGGILGRREGLVDAGRNVCCQFVNNARVRAGGDVTIANYCYDSELRCEGRLLMQDAVLSGGRVSAGGGAVVDVIGTKMHRETVVAVGIDEQFMADLVELEAVIQNGDRLLEEMIHDYEPYARQERTLRGVERRTAVRMKRQILEMRTSMADTRNLKVRMRRLHDQRAAVRLVVRKSIAAGVELQFEEALVMLRRPVEGPVTIEVRHEAGGPVIVAMSHETNQAQALDSRPYDKAA
jgi:uncharacterized protein (DUF342 family)